ncbi:twin-arginine translocase subunit TatC [Halobacterium zhouii]|uniref:twin-arginine translocase subunit TatC n=1 Tax=Halobacterium zhouii TaxID=2902624 RepID=UPI001E2847C5|nr:twin-arginine translocase subunit TatC [Halobacterium zhouii]
MPEEPDGGRNTAGEPAERDDEWGDLTPAVRRASEDGDSSGLAPADSAGDDQRDGDSSDDQTVDEAADQRAVDDGSTDSPGDDSTDDSDGDTGDEWEWSDDDFESVGPTSLEQGAGVDGATEEPADATDSAEPADSVAPVEPATGPGDSAGPTAESEDATVLDTEEMPDPTTGLGGGAPDSDVEQPLAVHVEEMVKRLAIVIAVAGLVSVAVFPVTEGLVTTIWDHVLPGVEAIDPRIYHPLELIITQIKVASLAGLVIALPVLVYQSYVFMRPGLYKQERRYYLAAVPTSLVLAVLGVTFSYFVVLPYTMSYFQGYTTGTANVAFALGTTFNLILMVMGYLAIVFQIPLFIMLAIMLGVVTRQWLEGRRLLFWGAFAGISFAFGSIDPTGVVPVLVAITMIVLFEGTLALLRWTGN